MKESIYSAGIITGEGAKLVLQRQNELRLTSDTKEKKNKKNIGLIVDKLVNELAELLKKKK